MRTLRAITLLMTIIVWSTTFGQSEQTFEAGDCTMELPKAFKQINDDGSNEMLEVKASCEMESFQFTLYSRWGNSMASSDTPNEPIEIKETLAEGVYMWILKGKTKGGEEFNFAGNLTVVK